MHDPPGFDEIYDEATLRLLDELPPAGVRPPLRGVRGSVAGAALATALVTGLKDSLDPGDADERIEDIDPGVGGGPTRAVTLFFVPDDPRATVAVVRPWLLP